MNVTFRQEIYQKPLDKYGYVILQNFANAEEINELLKVYEENKPENPDRQFYVSHWLKGGNLKKNIDSGLQRILVPLAQKYIDNHVPVFAALSIKHPGKESAMQLHQDWAHVNEEKFRSINIWVALNDIDHTNGPICLVKGSDRLFNEPRGVDTPQTFRYIGEENLQPYLTDIYLKAGDAIAWDHRVIHGSRINYSDKNRVAAVINLRPVESEFLLYYGVELPDITEVEVYQAMDEFFIEYDSVNQWSDVRKANYLYKMPYKDLHITEEKLKIFLGKEFPGEFNLTANTF
jgi:hypothetical protein